MKSEVLEQTGAATAVADYKRIPLDQIRPVNNPRKTFNQDKLKELADSILQVGIKQPLLVRYMPQKYTLHEPDLHCKEWLVLDRAGKEVFRSKQENPAVLWCGGEANLKPYYELVAGERRWRAAKIAKLADAPCIVEQLNDQDVRAIRLIENDQREDLNDVDRAEAYNEAIKSGDFTVETLYKKLGKSRSHVFGMLALLRLNEPVREALLSGKIQKSVASLIAQIPDEEQQVKLLKSVVGKGDKEGMSFRDVANLIERDYMVILGKAKWDLDDNTMLPCSCTKCPRRTGNMLDLFPELKGKDPNVCTDAPCFNVKYQQYLEGVLAEASKKGAVIIPLNSSKHLFSMSHYLYANSQYVRADEVCHLDKKLRTYRQLVSKLKVQMYAAIDASNDLQEMYIKEDVMAALKNAGIKLESAKPQQQEIIGMSSEEKRLEMLQRKLQIELDRGTGLELIKLVEMDVTLTEKAQTKFWQRFLSIQMHAQNQMGMDWERVFERRGVEIQEKVIDKLPWNQLRAICVEMMMLDGGHGGQVSFDDSLLQPAIKQWGMDAKAVQKRIKAEFEESNRIPKNGEEIQIDKGVLNDPEGPIRSAYSADIISSGKIKEPYSFRGYFWVNTGGCGTGNGGYEYIEMNQVAPLAEYQKKTYTYAQKSALRDPTKEALTYDGIKVAFGKTEYVFTDVKFKFVPKGESKPAKKKGKK
jgi:ParB/RepB/Spo0J family partition protein